MKKTTAWITCLLGFALLGGCAQYHNKRGVEAQWQADQARVLTKGKTTRAEVLDWLGPPSQVIALDDETVLYYLFERSAGVGLVLLVYNRFDVDTRYDRAIFFFDGDDLLTDYSTRIAGPTDG